MTQPKVLLLGLSRGRLVEHDVGLVMGTCEHIHVLDYGQVIASGPPDQVKDDPVVVNAYLGAP
jgi:branched-chain amino acid transport system ATP-binding protein